MKEMTSMLTIATSCPRCLEPRTTLQLVTADPPLAGYTDHLPREAVFRCVHCEKLVLVELRLPGNAPLVSGSGGVPTGDIAKYKGTISMVAVRPPMPERKIPEALPEQVASAYSEGLANLRDKRFNSAAAMFRSALDRTTKLLWTDGGLGDNCPFKLEARIRQLASRLSLPTSLVDWMGAIRVVGNELHELDDVSEQDARDVAHFAEVFLQYTYTLPARLTSFRERRESSGAG
jgi:hypothetical protein